MVCSHQIRSEHANRVPRSSLLVGCFLDHSCCFYLLEWSEKHPTSITMIRINTIAALYLLWKSQKCQKAKRRHICVHSTIHKRAQLGEVVSYFSGYLQTATIMHSSIFWFNLMFWWALCWLACTRTCQANFPLKLKFFNLRGRMDWGKYPCSWQRRKFVSIHVFALTLYVM